MDKTLLDKDGIPTIDELKDFFKNNDYSTAVSSFAHEKVDDETNQIYLRAKKLFLKFLEYQNHFQHIRTSITVLRKTIV